MSFSWKVQIVKLHINKQKIDPYYVLTFLNSNEGQMQIFRQIYGSTNKHLDIDGLKSIILPLNPNFKKLSTQLKQIEKLQVRMDLALDELGKFITPVGIKIR